MPNLDQILGMIASSSFVVCSGILGLSFLGLIFAIISGKTIFRAIQFSIVVVMLSLILPGAMLVGGYVAFNATSTFMANAQETSGEVVRLVEERTPENQIVYGAVVEFTPLSGGSAIEFDDNGAACDPACYQIGQTVPVLYDPENPSTATIKNVVTNWIWVGVFALLGAVFLIMGLWYISDSYRKDRYWRFFEEAAA
jgi:hypothetical protein